jgi:hypothetical protein
VNGTSAPVEQTATVALRTGEPRRLGSVEQINCRTALAPLTDASSQRTQGRLRRCQLQPAVADRLAGDAMSTDEIEHQVGPRGDGGHEL